MCGKRGCRTGYLNEFVLGRVVNWAKVAGGGDGSESQAGGDWAGGVRPRNGTEPLSPVLPNRKPFSEVDEELWSCAFIRGN